MSSLQEFCKAAPVGFRLHERPCSGQAYKYFVHGKGCSLGVLFEDSINVYFEWLTENGRLVEYPPEIRYKYWPKREFTRFLTEGIWEATNTPEIAA